MPNVLSPRDLVFRPDNIDETVPNNNVLYVQKLCYRKCVAFLNLPDTPYTLERVLHGVPFL